MRKLKNLMLAFVCVFYVILFSRRFFESEPKKKYELSFVYRESDELPLHWSCQLIKIDAYRDLSFYQPIDVENNPEIDKSNSTYLHLNSKICFNFAQNNTGGVFIFIVVFSRPENFQQRMFIRATWGSKEVQKEFKLVIAFFLGTNKNREIQSAVNEESTNYGDIIQESFEDTEQNQIVKSVRSLKWITNYCQHSTFVVKSEDYMVINIFNLMNHMKRLLQCEQVPSDFLCYLKSTVLGYNKHSIVEVPYCSGYTYVISTQLVPYVYLASLKQKLGGKVDVYVSGILAKAVNIAHRKWNSLYLSIRDMEDFLVFLSENRIFAGFKEKDGFQKDTRWQFWKVMLENEKLNKFNKCQSLKCTP